MGIDKSLQGHKAKGPHRLFVFGMATTSALLQILEASISVCSSGTCLLGSRLDFTAELAWIISSGRRESGLKAFPDFNSWKAVAKSYGENSLDIHLQDNIGFFQSWDTSLTANMADSLFIVLNIPFLTGFEAIELAVIGQRRRVCLVLTVKVVNYIPCQPTGVREVAAINSLRLYIFSFFVKMRRQGGSSLISCFTLRIA